MIPVLAAMAGATLLGARARSGAGRPLMVLAGTALLGFASLRHAQDAVVRIGTKRRATQLRLSFNVDLPVGLVFGYCRNFENFSRLISTVRAVEDTGDGRSHWTVSTPSGGTMEWDAVTTKYVPNSVLAWRSVQGSPVESDWLMRFVPTGHQTCVTLSIVHRVLDANTGDAFAALLKPRRQRTLAAEILALEHHLRDAVLEAAVEPASEE